MRRQLLLSILGLAIVSGIHAVQEQESDVFPCDCGSLREQVKELQKNVTEVWTYIYQLRNAMTVQLKHLRAHQVQAEMTLEHIQHHSGHSGQDSHDHHAAESAHHDVHDHHQGGSDHHDDHHHSESGHTDDHHHGESGHSDDHHHGESGHHDDHHDDHHGESGHKDESDHKDDHHHHHEESGHKHDESDHKDDHHHHHDESGHKADESDHKDDHHHHHEESGHKHDESDHKDDHHHHHDESGPKADESDHKDDHQHEDSDHFHHHHQGDHHGSSRNDTNEDTDHQHHDDHTQNHSHEDSKEQKEKEEVAERVVVATTHHRHSHDHGHNMRSLGHTHGHHSHQDHGPAITNKTTFPRTAEYAQYKFATCNVESNRMIPTELQQDVRGKVTLWQLKTGGPLGIHVRLQGFQMGDHHGQHQQTVQQDHQQNAPESDNVSNISHKHGFHVHAVGDTSNGCESMGPHYNPDGVNHGGPLAEERHDGDLGNIECDDHGVANLVFSDSVASLIGPNSILNRGLVVHSDPDDYGKKPDDPESLKTGNAGTRIACCIIQETEKPSLKAYRYIKSAKQYQNR